MPQKKKRVEIPRDIEAQVQFLSDRTCCVCRVRGKPFQIHHIDENPANNEPNNLVVLCLECHNETQIRGGFGRKLNADQIILYRDDWLIQVAKTRAANIERDKQAYPQQIEREQGAYERSLKDAKRERLRNAYKVLLNVADKYQFEAQQINHMPDAMNISLVGEDEAVNEISLEDDDTDVLPIFFALRGAFNDFAVKFSAHIGTGEEILKHKDTVLEKFEELKTAMKKHLKELES